MKTVFKTVVLFILAACISCSKKSNKDSEFIFYETNSRKENINFYWKNKENETIRSIGNLKKELSKNNKTLKFAMNGGMFNPGNIPKGLYIENDKVVISLDTLNGTGNFYLQPNGIFFITKDKKAFIEQTQNFKLSADINFATQSGPMLLVEGEINPIFQKESKNRYIRNGVGVLRNGNLIFAMSKNKINFHQFAQFFLDKGCKTALYLDGFVSRTYLPEKNWKQEDGDFGVMIGIVSEK